MLISGSCTGSTSVDTSLERSSTPGNEFQRFLDEPEKEHKTSSNDSPLISRKMEKIPAQPIVGTIEKTIIPKTAQLTNDAAPDVDWAYDEVDEAAPENCDGFKTNSSDEESIKEDLIVPVHIKRAPMTTPDWNRLFPDPNPEPSGTEWIQPLPCSQVQEIAEEILEEEIKPVESNCKMTSPYRESFFKQRDDKHKGLKKTDAIESTGADSIHKTKHTGNTSIDNKSNKHSTSAKSNFCNIL